MNIDNILNQFEERTLVMPKKALLEAVERKDEITPHLINMLQYTLENIEDIYNGDDDFFGYFYALPLLAQFKEKEAFPYIISFLQNIEDEKLEWLFGLEWSSHFVRFLVSTYNGDDKALIEILENPKTSDVVKGIISQVNTIVNSEDMSECVNDVIEFLRSFEIFESDEVFEDSENYKKYVEVKRKREQQETRKCKELIKELAELDLCVCKYDWWLKQNNISESFDNFKQAWEKVEQISKKYRIKTITEFETKYLTYMKLSSLLNDVTKHMMKTGKYETECLKLWRSVGETFDLRAEADTSFEEKSVAYTAILEHTDGNIEKAFQIVNEYLNNNSESGLVLYAKANFLLNKSDEKNYDVTKAKETYLNALKFADDELKTIILYSAMYMFKNVGDDTSYNMFKEMLI